MAVHQARVVTLAAVLIGISALVSMEACTRAQQRLDELRAVAEQGNAVAQGDLGFMYANGLGVLRDDAEAVRWYRLAADQGDADAQGNLGEMYADGRGSCRTTWKPTCGSPVPPRSRPVRIVTGSCRPGMPSEGA